MKGIIYFVNSVCCLFILAGCSAHEPHWKTKSIKGLLPDLTFSLTSENNQPVTAKDYRGKLNLVFFGFSHCQMICPMTLSKLAQVIKHLSPQQQAQVQVLFISVDPARDTPARLKDYSANFSPKVIGLTGSQKQLQTLTKRFRVTYGYGKANAEGQYQVSHSNGIYVFDKKGRARLLMRGDTPNKDISHDLHLLLNR